MRFLMMIHSLMIVIIGLMIFNMDYEEWLEVTSDIYHMFADHANVFDDKIIKKINEFKMYSVEKIKKLMNIWNGDKAMKKLDYSCQRVLDQCILIKERLFNVVVTDQFTTMGMLLDFLLYTKGLVTYLFSCCIKLLNR